MVGDQGKITSVTTYIEPQGIFPDGSLALARVIDIIFQPVKAAEFISLHTSINVDDTVTIEESK